MALTTPTGDIDVTELAKTLREQGMITPGQGDNGQKSPFQQMMMMAMLRNASDKNLAGYGLGKLLRQGFDSWKERYDWRGRLKGKVQRLGRDKTQEWIDEIAKTDPRQSEYLQEHLDKWIPQSPQPTQDAATMDKDSTMWQRALDATNNSLGDFKQPESNAFQFGNQQDILKGLLGDRGGALGQAATPTAEFPFAPENAWVYNEDRLKPFWGVR